MQQNERVLFAYQREELMAEKAVRDAHKMALKEAKRQWTMTLPHSKRSHYYQLILKLNADGLFAGEDCQAFMNRQYQN